MIKTPNRALQMERLKWVVASEVVIGTNKPLLLTDRPISVLKTLRQVGAVRSRAMSFGGGGAEADGDSHSLSTAG
jgi:hypothetical protein